MEPPRTCAGPGGFCHFRAQSRRELHMGVAQLEERRSPKPKVAGSSPAARADPGLKPRDVHWELHSERCEIASSTDRRKSRPARPRRTRRPARCQRETQDAARSARPRRQRRRATRCGVSASIPALGAGGRGSTPCISTLAPSSSMVERTPDTRTVGGSSPPSATHPKTHGSPGR